MYINAGELNKRVSIYKKPELDKDGYETEGADSVLVHTCWAKFSQTSGTELVRQNADMGEVKVRFLIRWTPRPVDRKMIVRYKGLDYEIVYLNTYGDGGEYMEIWCKRMSNEGGAYAGRQDQGGGDAAG